MDWQEIETAPKDGTYVLAYDARSPWPDDLAECYWIASWRGTWLIMLDGQQVNPTHWMPLPPPPISTRKD